MDEESTGPIIKYYAFGDCRVQCRKWDGYT